MIATRYGCRVTGVDLTPQFVETARALSAMCGMEDRVRFEVGSAVALPFPDASFDLALLLHVGMNVPDKAALFREARRVVVKLGTSVVTGAGGEVCAEHIEPIVRSLAGLRKQGRDCSRSLRRALKRSSAPRSTGQSPIGIPRPNVFMATVRMR